MKLITVLAMFICFCSIARADNYIWYNLDKNGVNFYTGNKAPISIKGGDGSQYSDIMIPATCNALPVKVYGVGHYHDVPIYRIFENNPQGKTSAIIAAKKDIKKEISKLKLTLKLLE